MNISIIVAVAENGVIGGDNSLLWHISDDLKRFKAITTGHKIIMGRKTFDSLPFKPLPNRENIIITRNTGYTYPGCQVCNSVDEVIEKLDQHSENFVIGGEEIYKQFINLANKVYLTKVHKTYEGDAYFPELNGSEWKEEEKQSFLDAEIPYSFVNYTRIK